MLRYNMQRLKKTVSFRADSSKDEIVREPKENISFDFPQEVVDVFTLSKCSFLSRAIKEVLDDMDISSEFYVLTTKTAKKKQNMPFHHMLVRFLGYYVDITGAYGSEKEICKLWSLNLQRSVQIVRMDEYKNKNVKPALDVKLDDESKMCYHAMGLSSINPIHSLLFCCPTDLARDCAKRIVNDVLSFK
jgi:hypothetical protein